MYDLRTHSTLENNFVSTLIEHALKETKILRGNQKAYFHVDFWKQLMIKALTTKLISQKISLTIPSVSAKFE